MKKLLLVLTFIMLVLACGGKSGSSQSGNGKEKTFVMNLGGEPKSIDPQISNDILGGTVNDFISEGLLKKSTDGKPVAGLAEKWQSSPDGLVWTFHLREGVKWSNGDPITANDFKVAWIRALNADTASEYAYMLYPIKNGEKYNKNEVKEDQLGIKVIDDKTLEVTLEAPTPYFDDLVTFKTYMPLNGKFFNDVKDSYFLEANSSLSSGAYVLKEWTHNQEMTLEKNPNYWDAANIKVDTIVLKLIEDNAAALSAFKNNEVDVTSITAEQAKEFKNDPRYVASNDGSVWYLLYNTNEKALSNSKIRKALLMAVDREEMTKNVLNGTGTPAKTFVPAEIGINGLNGDFATEVPTSNSPYNVEEAKKLLAEGLKEIGMDALPTIEMIINDGGNNKVIAEFVQENLRKNLNVELNISIMTPKERWDRMQRKDFTIALAGWSGDFKDAITYLDLFVTNGGNNNGSYSNPKYDELVKTIKSSGDPTVRVPAMVELEKIISEDVPVGPLYHRKKEYLVNPKVQGIKFTAIGGEYYFGNLDVK